MLEYDFEKRFTSEKLFLEFRKKFPNKNEPNEHVEELAAQKEPRSISENLGDHNTVCNSILLT
jgi:hypothetical protein